MEPSRIELLSRLAIDRPLIHRLSCSDPHNGVSPLPRRKGFSGEVLSLYRPEASKASNRWGFTHRP